MGGMGEDGECRGRGGVGGEGEMSAVGTTRDKWPRLMAVFMNMNLMAQGQPCVV